MSTTEVPEPSGIGVCVLETSILGYLKHLVDEPDLPLTLYGVNDLRVLAEACALFETIVCPNSYVPTLRHMHDLNDHELVERWLNAQRGWEFVNMGLSLFGHGHTPWYNDMVENGPGWIRGEPDLSDVSDVNNGGEHAGENLRDAWLYRLESSPLKDPDLLAYLDLYAAMAESHQATLMSNLPMHIESYGYRQRFIAPQVRILKAYEHRLRKRIETIEQSTSTPNGALDRYAPLFLYQALTLTSGEGRKDVPRAFVALHHQFSHPYRAFFMWAYATKDPATREELFQEAERLLIRKTTADTSAPSIGQRIKEKVRQVLPVSARKDKLKGVTLSRADYRRIGQALEIFNRFNEDKPTTFELYGALTKAFGRVDFTRQQLNAFIATRW